jgi:hypothetical protein
MNPWLIAGIILAVVIGPPAVLAVRNERRLMADLDRLATPDRTCPPVDLDTELRKLLEAERGDQ